MKSRSLGFTLIELLIVIAVLGALAAVIITVLNPLQQFKKARDAQRRSDIKQIQNVLEQYYNDNGKYPDSGSGFVYSTSALDPWIPGLSSNYAAKLPRDPKNICSGPPADPATAGCYSYSYYSVGSDCPFGPIGNNQNYVLVTRFESYEGSDLSQVVLKGSCGRTYTNLPVSGLMVVQAP